MDSARIVFGVDAPFAVVRRPGQRDIVVSWPDLDVGARATTSTVLAAPTGAWVFYRPLDADDTVLPQGSPAAVHVSADGDVTRFTELAHRHLLGVTRHGLWLSAETVHDPEDEAAWRRDHHATVLAPDGRTRVVTTDRCIAFALDDSRRARLVLYRDAPRATRSRPGGATYTHRYIAVPLTGELADAIRLADRESEAFDEHELLGVMASTAPQPPDDPPIEPAPSWELVNLSENDREAAIRSVIRGFDHLADYWHSAEGRTFPLSPGLADPRVEAIGAWPATVVSVSFTHPLYPEGRLRRSLRVFDDAGRIRPAMHAAIHLMEDLGTAAVLDTDGAQDGILEF